MELVLCISRHPEGVEIPHSRYTFDLLGGVIGRGQDCDWVLPDPRRILSSHHALVGVENRCFFIEDTSTNGVYVNQSSRPLGRNQRHVLCSGDTLRMGEYVLDVVATGKEETRHSDMPAAEPEPEPVAASGLAHGADFGPTDFSLAEPEAKAEPVATIAPQEAPRGRAREPVAPQSVSSEQAYREMSADTAWSLFVRELGIEDYLRLRESEDTVRQLARVYRSALRVILKLLNEEAAFYRRHHLTPPDEGASEVNPMRISVNERQLLQQLIFDRQPECMDIEHTMQDTCEGLTRHMHALEAVVASLCPRKAFSGRDGSVKRERQRAQWLEQIMRERYFAKDREKA